AARVEGRKRVGCRPLRACQTASPAARGGTGRGGPRETPPAEARLFARAERLPVPLRLGELLLVVALQVLGFGHVALVDGAVVVAEGLAQRERRGAGQGAAGDRADEGD